MTLWIVLVATAAGCYLLKFAGLAAPRRLLDNVWLRRFATAVPLALLAALIAVEALRGEGQALAWDTARMGGVAAAVAALVLRAPFLVVVVAAAAVTAGLRALGL
ncbi:AzlD domain-containing protein [Nocardiopsis flavescens]|uniref:Branched-chain amino acid transport protein (AzlD) n=1 Tax=Nocardiopsis flavescens TaxID=758803 RepID=A0A1M6EWF2_9ACTN|nr:AzlD domain-containing protein [Nocardiopsis flavescens]SHI89743.1 Branched-chain amino acid transport protein (AzlD) [Nocardiopsis flavescens]